MAPLMLQSVLLSDFHTMKHPWLSKWCMHNAADLQHNYCGNSSTLVLHMPRHASTQEFSLSLHHLRYKLRGLHVQHKATYVRMECKTCHTVRTVTCKPGFGGAMIPRTCDAATVGGQGNTCGQDPFIILPAKTQYVDQQQLKLQVGYKPIRPSPGVSPWSATVECRVASPVSISDLPVNKLSCRGSLSRAIVIALGTCPYS